MLVQGHHGGLGAMQELKGWAAEKGATGAATQALEAARRLIPELEPHHPVDIPDFVKLDPVKAELWLRMVFSALVDADFLDTERHFNPGRAAVRSSEPDMAQLWERFQPRHRESVRGASGTVNAVRSEVYDACLAAAERPPGVFRLTVPTGGGKTLSALGFALRHASAHGLRRIVTATPFMSITQQTAEVYREFLEQDANTEPSVVLEHHSMADMNEDGEYDRGQVWSRLAAENWDAPVVVTTTVQLFHSLFSNRTSSTRKLHRLAQSLIILGRGPDPPSETPGADSGYPEGIDRELRGERCAVHRDPAGFRDHQALRGRPVSGNRSELSPPLPGSQASQIRMEDGTATLLAGGGGPDAGVPADAGRGEHQEGRAGAAGGS